jgi:hypothetical protein
MQVQMQYRHPGTVYSACAALQRIIARSLLLSSHKITYNRKTTAGTRYTDTGAVYGTVPVSYSNSTPVASIVYSSSTSGVFYTHFYNHAHRPRLEKLLYLELSRTRSPKGFFKALLDPGDRSASETAARRFQNRNGRYETVSEVKRLQIYNGHM